MLWIRQNKNLLLCTALALILGLGTGVLLTARMWAVKIPEEPIQAAEPVAQGGKPGILPDTAVQVEYRFLLCGHTITKDETNGAFTGLTMDEIRGQWPDVRAAAIEGKNAFVERELESYCPEHYVLFSDETGQLCISHTEDTDLTREVVTTLKYDPASLPKDVLAVLEDGIDFASLEEINGYLESMES